MASRSGKAVDRVLEVGLAVTLGTVLLMILASVATATSPRATPR